ncbi:MAG: polysaccharide deacetylase family protein [Lachnospiraceae bacterium]|nr:polysaccharide deacetylase family protein [Lachnospiraceae bacterium]
MKKKRIIVITAIAIAAVAAAVLYFFVFRKMDIKTSRFMVSKSEVYTGEAICPPVKVVRKDKITNRTHTLKERIDYKVEYRNNINAGEAEIIVTGINRYRGGVKIPFTVAPAPLESISVIPTEQYTGQAIVPVTTVKSGEKKLRAKKDYDVSLEDNTNVGLATVTAAGKGNYTGNISANFEIIPQRTYLEDSEESDTEIKVKWPSMRDQITGYQLQYGFDDKFRRDSKIDIVSDASKTSAVITKDKPDGAYFVRIRTYMEVGDRAYYSYWSEPVYADGFKPLAKALTAAVKAHDVPLYKRAISDSAAVLTLPFSAKLTLQKSKSGWYYASYKQGDTTQSGYITSSSVVTYNPDKKHVALTFDDGPNADTTKIVLEALKKNNCRATFFIVGKNVTGKTNALVKMEKDLGCELGNHSFDHARLPGLITEEEVESEESEASGEPEVKLNTEAAQAELDKTDEAVKAAAGVRPTVCRAPYGEWSDAVLSLMNRPHILWSLDTLDWKYRDTERLIEVVRDSRQDGDIILMHDIHETTANAIDQICQDLTEDGYETVTVTELAAINGISLGNATYNSFKK